MNNVACFKAVAVRILCLDDFKLTRLKIHLTGKQPMRSSNLLKVVMCKRTRSKSKLRIAVRSQ